jgi:hypothetical protein
MHYLISIIFLFSVSGVFAQSIDNVGFRSEGKAIVVTYDFFHSKADTAINVKLLFKDPQGGVVTPKTITGDIKNVKPGESKRIVWDILSDGIRLSGNYKAEVSVSRGGFTPYEKSNLGDSTITPIEVDIPVEVDIKESFEEGNFIPDDHDEPLVHDKSKEIIETFVDEEAEFPGGYPAMMAFIQKSLVFPITAIENNVQGKCFIRFVVSVDGSISNVTVTMGVPDCPECDKASIKAIRSMPNWKAGKLNGRSVSSYCSITINFAIETDEIEMDEPSTLKKNIFSLSIIDDALQDFKYKGISNGLSYERHLKGAHSLVAGINVCKNLDKTDDISFFIPRMEKAIGFKAYLQHKHYLKRKQLLWPLCIVNLAHALQFNNQPNENTGYYLAESIQFGGMQLTRRQITGGGTYLSNRNDVAAIFSGGFLCQKKCGLFIDVSIGIGIQYLWSSAVGKIPNVDQPNDSEPFLSQKEVDYGSAFLPYLSSKFKIGWGF